MAVERPARISDPNAALTYAERAELDRLRGLAGAFDDVVFTLDVELRCTGIYGRGLTRVGLPPESFLGKNTVEMVGAEAARVHEAACRRALAGEDVNYEWATGGDIQYAISMSALRDADGGIVGVAGVGHDVTARKRAELAQQEAELQLQLVMDQAQEGIVLTDEELRVIIWNPAMQAITGHPADHVLGRYLWDVQTEVTVPDHRQANHADRLRERHLATLRAGGELGVLPMPYEVPLQRGDGSICETEHTALVAPTQRGHRFVTFIRDITERKATQRQLRLWGDVFANAAWAVLVIDAVTGDILTANPAATRLFGYVSAEELSRISFAQLLALDARTQDADSPVAHAGHAERWCRRQDDSRFLAAIDAALHRDANGDVLYTIVNVRDVTLRRQHERERLQTLERYRAMVDRSPLAIFVLDPAGCVLQWNPGAERVFGWTAAEVVGKRPPYLDAESEADFDKNVAYCLAGNSHHGKELRRRHKDGRLLYLSTASAPLHDAEGNVVAVMVMGDDITERKQAEEQLRLWGLIFNKAGWGVTLVDDATSRVVAANPAAFAMYGYAPEEYIGKDILEFYAPEERANFVSYRETLLRTGEVQYETAHVRRDGSRFIANVVVTLYYDSDGQVLYRIANVQDISEHRQLEEERLQALKQFRAVFDASPLGIILLDCEGRVLQWNSGAEDIFGWTADEAIGALPPFVTPATEPQFRANLAASLASEQRRGVEAQRQHKDGHPIVINSSSGLLRDSQGNIAGVILMVEDVTQRTQAEEQLRLWELTFHDAGWGVIVIDIANDRIITANPAANTIYGYDDLTQVAPIDLVAPDMRLELADRVVELDHSEGQVRYESYGARKDGERFPIEIIRSVHRHADGTPHYRIISFQDLSERRRLEAERATAFRRFRAVFDASPLAMYVYNADAQVELWNPAAERIFGWRAEEVVGKSLLQLDPQSSSGIHANLARLRAGGVIVGNEIRRRRKDGRWIDLSLTSGPLFDEQGQVAGLISIAEDISERKAAEEQLRLWEMVFREAAWGILVADAQTNRVVAANSAALAMYGYPHDEMIGLPVKTIFAPQDQDRLATGTDAVLAQGYIRYISMHVRKDGTEFPVDLDVSVYRDQDGKPRYLLANIQDVTERRRMEAERLDVLQRFEIIVESSPLGIVMVDSDRLVQIWNPTAGRVFGWTRDEVIGKPLPYLDETSAPEFQHNQNRILSGESFTSAELRRRRKDGRLIDISVASAPISDSEGRAIASLSIFEDITERKANEEQLRLWEMIFREAGWAVYVADDKTNRIVAANPAALDMYGYTYDEFIGADMGAIIAPEFRSQIPAISQEVYASGHHAGERYHVRKDGTQFPVAVSLTTHRDAAGDVLYRIANVQDITQRRRMEAERLEALERFRTLIEASPLAILALDTAGVIELWNAGAEHIFGWRATEAIGQTPYQLAMMDLAQFKKNMAYALSDDTQLGREVRRKHKDGRMLDLSLSTAPIRGARGEIIGAIAIFEDISARKQAQTQLERANARLQLLHVVDQAIIGVRSPQEITSTVLHRLVEATHAARASILLYDNAQTEFVIFAVNSLGSTTVGPGVRGSLSPERLHALQKRRSVQSDVLRDVDEPLGTVRRRLYVEGLRAYVSVPLFVGDESIGQLNLFSMSTEPFPDEQIEIAQEVAAQAAIALYQAQLVEKIEAHNATLEERVAARTRELEAANVRLRELARLKDEFLANMSHELRTPLTGVLNLAEAMAEEAYGPLTPAQSHTVAMIVESGRLLADLISDLLDISRIEAGRLNLQMEPCNLNDVCHSSLRVVQSLAQKRGQTLVFDHDPEPVVIIADARRVKQMLLNLLSNAIKFTPEGGRVTLRLGKRANGREIYLAVCDNGVGIHAEDMPKLFQPFSRLDSALVSHTPGTGLGLALVKRMVELHGGAIDVKSDPGVGSCFQLVLPVRPPISASDAQATDRTI